MNLDWVEQATGQAGPSLCERLGHSWREAEVPHDDAHPELRMRVCRTCGKEAYWMEEDAE